MAPLPSAAFARITHRFGGAALPFGAVITHGVTAPVGDPRALAAAAADLFVDEFITSLVNEITYLGVSLKMGPESSGATYVEPRSTAGADSRAAVPANTAALIRLEPVGVSGRFAGRMFLPGIPEAEVTGSGAINNTFRGQLQVAANGYMGGLVTVGLVEPVIISSVGSDPREVDAAIVQAICATQRRRMRR